MYIEYPMLNPKQQKGRLLIRKQPFPTPENHAPILYTRFIYILVLALLLKGHLVLTKAVITYARWLIELDFNDTAI